MSRELFNILLVVYAAVAALNACLDRILPLHGNQPRRNLVDDYLATRSKQFLFLFLSINSLLLLAGITGYIGMFFLWPRAPFIFFTAIAAKILCSPLIPVSNPQTKWECTCAEIELFMDGFLAALVFFGPARALFFR